MKNSVLLGIAVAVVVAVAWFVIRARPTVAAADQWAAIPAQGYAAIVKALPNRAASGQPVSVVTKFQES